MSCPKQVCKDIDAHLSRYEAVMDMYMIGAITADEAIAKMVIIYSNPLNRKEDKDA